MVPSSRGGATAALLLLMMTWLAACLPLPTPPKNPASAAAAARTAGGILARVTPELRAILERRPEAVVKEKIQRLEEELRSQATRQFKAPNAAAAATASFEDFDQAGYDAEHAALLAIKAAANFDNGQNFALTTWMPDTNHCTGGWIGVDSCSTAGRVTSLDFFFYYGPLMSQQLEVLSKLQYLSMQYVFFPNGTQLPATWPAAFPDMQSLTVSNAAGLSGSIPDTWGDFKALQYLSLSGNGLVSSAVPSSLGKLSSLQTLDLSSNLLTGAVSDLMKRMPSSLVSLMLSGNKLNTLGASWDTTHVNLARLILGDCLLTGPLLPDILGRLPSLVTLVLSGNQLSGSVGALGGLIKLETLNLARNNFSGPLPVPLPPGMRDLTLSENDFTGGLPDAYASLTNLSTLSISGNPRLGGVLPASYSALTNLDVLSADRCGLTAIEPGLVLPNVVYFDASDNSITSSLPSFVGWSKLSSLALRKNKVSGRLPDPLTTFPPLLQALDLSFNEISGAIPPSLADLPSLAFMLLGSNRFSGPVPSWNMSKFYYAVDLSRNCLSGRLPCLDPARLPSNGLLSICHNPVSPEACGPNTGALDGCLAPQVSIVNVENGSLIEFGTLACFPADPLGLPITESWHAGTGVSGFCGIESYSKASDGTCFQQSNSPNDPWCRGAAAKPQQPWGFFNKGPSAGDVPTVMRMPVATRSFFSEGTSWCERGNNVGYASAVCSVSGRGQESITFNLTTANADQITTRMFWMGCKPPKSAADASSRASASAARGQATVRTAAANVPKDPRRPCNQWRAVPATAKRIVGATHTSTIWSHPFPNVGTTPPPGGCTCNEVFWSLYAAKPDTVCGFTGGRSSP